jgi:pSer/pThr/pTyr-binding forkhead associated (FHA) protein
VSRHHAELRVENDQVVLVDLGSTNGTFVNGQPVRRVTLSDGTRIALGRTTLIFRQDPLTNQDGQGSGYSGSSY